MSKLIITLTNGQSDYDIAFNLLPTSVAQNWIKHLELFIQSGQPWDDTERFYNFLNTKFTKPMVILKLQELVNTIKNYAPDIITREIIDPLTQDDLNYLHHIFEVYHGLYDQQDQNDFFTNAPKEVQDALGDLNIWIHRYETLGGFPRFVATWKYKPYRDQFEDHEFKYFNLREEWGDLSLNYCEIGKTLYDLWHDNDQYILSEAFQPLHHYCFDFTVRFADFSNNYYKDVEQKVWEYFDQHQDFFNKLGYHKHDPKLSLGMVTIGKISTTDTKEKVIESISNHQKIKNIKYVNTQNETSNNHNT
jgi:hypothetical protein